MKVRRTAVVLTVLALLGGLVVGCGDGFEAETNLVVINNTNENIVVEIDEDLEGTIRTLGTVPPRGTAKWEVDAGDAIVYLNGEGVLIYLDPEFDGVLEVNPN